jgi:hypothetical protein
MKSPSPGEKPGSPGRPAPANEASACVRRHLRIGWWSLWAFLTLGIALETLHGFKVGWYLGVANATRRLMFTLAHAHGTLLALVNIGFAVTVPWVPAWDARTRAVAGNCLLAAGLLIPAGFFLGGLVIYAGDPGLGIVLVPVGAVCLLVGVWLTARAVTASRG